MKSTLERIDLVSIGGVAAMAATAAYTGLKGPPGRVPIHLGLDGSVDRWGSSGEAALGMLAVTLVAAGIAGFCAWLKRDPRTAEQAARSPAALLYVRILGLAAPALGVGLLAAMAFGGVRPGEDGASTMRLVMGGLSLLFLLIGALLGKTPPNAFVGVRTYWSLTSRLAWDRSNRLAGRLLFWAGLAGLVATPFAPPALGLQAVIAAVLAAAAWSTLESWRVWRLDPARRAV